MDFLFHKTKSGCLFFKHTFVYYEIIGVEVTSKMLLCYMKTQQTMNIKVILFYLMLFN